MTAITLFQAATGCLRTRSPLNRQQNRLLLRTIWSTSTNSRQYEDDERGSRVYSQQQQRKPIVCARQRQTEKQHSNASNGGWDQQIVLSGNTLALAGGQCHESIPGILGHSSLRVTRKLEMMSIFLGYEQANRYALLDPHGNAVGFMAEEYTLWSTIGRQFLRLHRPFRVHVLDLNGRECMTIWRNFSLINSKVFVADHRGRTIGESQQQWHMWRRRYNMFVDHHGEVDENQGFDRRQFAEVDAPFLSWDFPFLSENGALLGGVYRDFSGIGMELFTDYGLYAICFDRLALAQRYQAQAQAQNQTWPAASPGVDAQTAGAIPALAGRDLNLDERAVALAAAVSIDFDYFSRHSRMAGGGGGFWIFPFSTSNDYTDIGGDS
ncbi:hypothetical protein IW140_004643 [Coemansia sp. RSA 1813]|nr:hypothetical protein EV178_004722 [Coemansia sp. RSA 1646]KAJ1770154.1 hypothetical protein LPJ74_003441 [Coemansia sp. RSA 1843]KAJ2087635.1 hypothetical protein IW138_004838 [Coemansia sp. RSA 986]KAJ2214379.1 hypothetical protein EV179_003044 [Coemansia sp. RSA 487]KAJ2567076.1 hypothetical protein IW140_004643 [Coemansia sp. RSA 1813]